MTSFPFIEDASTAHKSAVVREGDRQDKCQCPSSELPVHSLDKESSKGCTILNLNDVGETEELLITPTSTSDDDSRSRQDSIFTIADCDRKGSEYFLSQSRENVDHPQPHLLKDTPSSKSTSASIVSSNTEESYIGRKFLKEFEDPANPGCYRLYEGCVVALQFVHAIPFRQYLLKYTDGDEEHQPLSEVERLAFCDQDDQDLCIEANVQKKTCKRRRKSLNSHPVDPPSTATDERRVPSGTVCTQATTSADERISTILDRLRPDSSARDLTLSENDRLLEDDKSTLDCRSVGRKRRPALPFHSDAPPLSAARVSSIMKKICFKFSWQLGNRQIQCDLCKKWWTEDRVIACPGDTGFSCSHKGGFCGIECLICRELLEFGEGEFSRGGTKDVVLTRAARLTRHLESSSKCVPDPRALACLLADLEDSIPWRAVVESRVDLVGHFRSACATVTSYAGVGAALLWLVQSLKRDAVRAEHLPDLEALAERLCVAEGAVGPANARRTRGSGSAAARPCGPGTAQGGPAQHGAGCGVAAADAAGGGGGEGRLAGRRAEQRRQQQRAAGGLAAAMLFFVDEHVLDWVGMETLNRLWERSATGWVESAVLEQDTGFRYVPRSELVHGGLSELRQVAAKMRLARQRCDPPGYCPECAGSGRNPSAQDEDCGTCLGMGVVSGDRSSPAPISFMSRSPDVVSGDSPFKAQLAHGPPFKLRVRPAGEGKGLGVFAAEDIEAGRAVCEYVGEVISVREARAREREYAEQGLVYMFEPRQLAPMMARWVTDATRKGNVARFVNHACGPGGNLVVRHFAASGALGWQDKVPLRLALVSSRRIAAGEELLYDYAPGGDSRLHVPYAAGGDPAPDADPPAEEPQQSPAAPQRLVRCRCGHSACRGWIF